MAIVKIYRAEIVSLTENIKNVYTVEFKPLRRKFRYRPGQFLHLALDEYDPSSGWPESRCFSMQSSPDEEVLRITYAVKGKYTSRMAKEMEVGKDVQLKLPFGELFTQEHSKKNTVFIAGGTGITPFLSLFAAPSFSEYRDPFLYAGFRDKSMNLYQKELQLASEINPAFQIKTFYEDKDGIINIAEIFEESDRESSFFISGPPAMIKSFKEYFIAQGVGDEQVKTDDWE